MSSANRPSSIHELRNIWLCPLHEEAVRPEFCDLFIADGKIAEIRPSDYRRYLQNHDPGSDSSRFAADPGRRYAEYVDAAGRVATPPMVNFHEHLYSRLAKGLALPGPMQDFRNILKNLWWQLDEALDAEMVDACARLGAMEALRSGVGYLFDHHSSPNFIEGSLDALGGILSEAGLRAVLCLETSDRHSRAVTDACLEEQRRFIRRSATGNLRGLVGLHAPFTLSDQTLERAAALCRELEVGIHIHLAEDRHEQRYSRNTFGCTAAVRLQRAGLLEYPGILAHGVHLQGEDWKALGKGRCALVMNPDSNLNNAVGLGRYTEIPNPIVLLAGTDGMHASPSRSIKQLFLLHRHQGGEIAESFAFIRKLYLDQVRFLRTFFPDYPDLKPGDRADLVIWDYRPPSPFTGETFWGHLIYGILETTAWTVCMQGRALLAGYGLRSLDCESTARLAARQGARLFEKLGVHHHG
ncbi:MAG: amidohydrolase family protein [Spirochaetaceae bacterium]|nr:MAG: amidohydrolase family protein [Spirochaetaceae bacterium]